jgi:hypothetical protein
MTTQSQSMMKEDDSIPEFALFGGPLQRMGRRLGLVRGGNTVWLGVALGLLAWGVLVVLALLQGVGTKAFSLAVLGIHVRFLVAVPLFFLCETWVGPRMADFVLGLVRSGVVRESDRPALAEVIRRVNRLKDPWPAEIAFLLVVLAFVFIEPVADLPGRTGNWKMLVSETGGGVGPVLGWYLWFCLPLFRFLLLRWLWHLGLWCYFLWRLQRLDLHLVPTHPDHVAGLGYLEIVQEHFCALALAISVVLSASFAEGIAAGSMAFETLYHQIPMVLFLVALLFLGPLLLFMPRLWACRVIGVRDYTRLASDYVDAFERKWVRGENPSGDSVLGTPDLQSLADLTNSVTVVHAMRWGPASRRLVLGLVAATLFPMLPLVFFRYPVSEVAARVFQSLTGL